MCGDLDKLWYGSLKSKAFGYAGFGNYKEESGVDIHCFLWQDKTLIQWASVSKQVTFEKNGYSSVMLLEDCREKILFCGSEEEKQETGVGFTDSSLLRITGLRNKTTSQKILLYCTVLF